MSKLHRRRGVGNLSPAPLLEWAEAQSRRYRVTLPARWLRRRCPLSPERAELIADLAGLRGAR